MSTLDERFLIYAALAILCSTVSVFLGLAAGVWSFLQICAVIELLFWIGAPEGDDSVTNW
ncbi:MAG: hypothetical protein HOC23_18340 [Halieaceae bacterium]|jgi:hypothetical protein|nr:hypothetical protein [Halieaceae bacterium]